MKLLTAVVTGATGLIGNLLTQQLLNDAAFGKVRVLVRKPIALQHPKLEVEVVDFNNLTMYEQAIGTGDCFFCCIGTTMKQVKGDKTAYRKIDYDIAVHGAQLAKQAGFTHYLLVSAVGAATTASNFYLQLKGETEQAITALQLPSLSIFQPSFLLGQRNAFRLGEALTKNLFKYVSFLLGGTLTKYKAIEATDVAKAMVAAAKKQLPSTTIYQYTQMQQLIQQP